MMPFDLGLAGALWIAGAIVAAAYVRGYSGFGYSAIVVAASGLVVDPLSFVAVVGLLELVLSAQSWQGAGRLVDWRRIGFLLVGALIGMPLGLWVLTSISADAARGVISLFVLGMCGVLLVGWRLAREVTGGGNILAGLVSGLANAPGMGGLPLAAFFAAQPMSAAVFRATLIGYFAVLDLLAVPMYGWHGLISADTFVAVLWALPLTVLGNWLGGRHFFGTKPQEFRRMAILLLAVLAGLGLVKALIGG